MKKYKKLSAVVLLTAAVCLAVTGCGNNTNGNGTGTGNSNTIMQTETPSNGNGTNETNTLQEDGIDGAAGYNDAVTE